MFEMSEENDDIDDYGNPLTLGAARRLYHNDDEVSQNVYFKTI